MHSTLLQIASAHEVAVPDVRRQRPPRMRCIPAPRTLAVGHIRHRFDQAVASIWRQNGRQRRLGLAVSGGVDSMALASLCGRFTETARAAPGFLAFVVDHGLREGSSREASRVASALLALDIQPHILTLDWKAHGDPSTLNNFETVARTLRYQALGRACYESGIRSLLVGHHADDQAETILLRLVGGYMGTGLRGIRPQARIPECQGIYGVDSSGEPRVAPSNLTGNLWIEEGGVTLFRPLLPFTKQQLIEICQQDGVAWFEDHTNSDQTLTARNTVRYLQHTALLPVALRRQRLTVLADTLQSRAEHVDLQAQRLLERMSVRVDLQRGVATCSYDSDLLRKIREGRTFKAVLLRKLINLVTPRRDVVLQELQAAAESLFQENAKSARQQIAGVFIQQSQRDSETRLLFHREPPYSRRVRENVIQLHVPSAMPHGDNGPAWSGWHLWDNRYWLRVGRQGSGSEGCDDKLVSVRFLANQDVGRVRKSAVGPCLTGFEGTLASARGMLRSTLPALVSKTAGEEVVEALPSLSWAKPGWRLWTPTSDPAHDGTITLVWDIRYRSIETERAGSPA